MGGRKAHATQQVSPATRPAPFTCLSSRRWIYRVEDLTREAGSLRRDQLGEVASALVLNPTGTRTKRCGELRPVLSDSNSVDLWDFRGSHDWTQEGNCTFRSQRGTNMHFLSMETCSEPDGGSCSRPIIHRVSRRPEHDVHSRRR